MKPDKTENDIFEVVMGAILTQNTSWKGVEKALVALTKRATSFQDLIDIDPEELKVLIRPAGFFNQKAAYLKSISELFIVESQPNRPKLLACKGIGPETADAILLYALNQPFPVIDTYTRRLLSRVHNQPEYIRRNYQKIQTELLDQLSPDPRIVRQFHALTIVHSQAVCHKKEPLCEKCAILARCAYENKGI
ncbi:MAG: endonuclease III domain-containing protein [Candidatus Thorarchaeota archaeon]